jgi:hypothetical protein
MATPTYSDQAILAASAAFIARVQQAMIAACITTRSKPITPGNPQAVQAKQAAASVQIRTNPQAFKMLFAIGVATDPNVIANATQNGPLATSTVDTQQLLVTDANIDVAIANQFNGFFTDT